MKALALPSTLALTVCLLAGTTEANASWVSNTGDDANNCAVTFPCRTFQRAHDAALSSGDSVFCLTSGEFGSLNITKDIVVDCTGHTARVVNLTVNAPASATVTLRGLVFGAFGLPRAIHFFTGKSLHVENCRISGYLISDFPRVGIYFNPSGASELFVTDSVISHNGSFGSGGGIVVHPTGAGSAFVALNRVTLNRNFFGIFAQGLNTTGAIVVEVRDSSVARSESHGIYVATDDSLAGIVIERSSSVLNAGNGVLATGTGAIVHIGNTTVRGNGVGLGVSGGGNILSFQNNQVAGNGNDGAPTGVLALK